MKAIKSVRLIPKTVITNFSYTDQTFSCYIPFRERLKILFGKTSWFTIHGSDINRLARGMESFFKYWRLDDK